MKRILILAMLLAGCEQTAQPGDPMPALKLAARMAIMVHTDPETGCQYLRLENIGRELTPRIAADGKTHMGCKAVAP